MGNHGNHQKRGYHNVRGHRGYSDSMASHSSSQHSQRMNQFQVPVVSNLDKPMMPLVNQSSEDSLMNEMQTRDWIAGDSGVFGSSSSVQQQQHQGQIQQDLQQGQYPVQQQMQQQQHQGLPAPEDRQHFHGGTHSSIPNLPPSTRPSGKNTMVSEHGDVIMSQDIENYMETDHGIQAAEVELEMEDGHVSPQHDGYSANGGPDHEMYNVAAKITIGNEFDNEDDEYGDNGGDDDDIYGDPNQQENGQGNEYENEYYDDEDDDDLDDIEPETIQ